MATTANNLGRLNILEAARHKDLFAPWFKRRFFQKSDTWARWFSFLRVLFGLELDEQDLELFRQCTGRSDVPAGTFTETFLICGRRAGKSFMLSLIAVYLACFKDWTPFLTQGERATIAIISADRKQSATIFRYIVGLIEGVKILKPLIQRRTLDIIELSNNVTIEISTASFKTIRGRTLCACLCDEIAFWSDEGANPDKEILAAVRPAMATVEGGMLLCASSPYARRGVLYDTYRRRFGKDGSDALIWKAGTRTMNPSVKQSVVDDAMAEDAASARAEYLGEFRDDIESFIDRALVESLVVPGRLELARLPGVTYHAFVDPAGGSGGDSMVVGVAHKDPSGQIVLDAIREAKPPFSPQEVVAEFAALLLTYRISTVTGDAWGGAFVREPFAPIRYRLAEQTKSNIYRDVLALLNSRRVQLLDHPGLVAQLCGLERRTARGGRDSIDHAPGQHDDVSNAAMGSILLANSADHSKVSWSMTSVPGRSAKTSSRDYKKEIDPDAPSPFVEPEIYNRAMQMRASVRVNGGPLPWSEVMKRIREEHAKAS